MWYFEALWAVLPGIITGIVLAFWNRRQNRKDSAKSQAEEDRLESEMFRLDLEVATAQLSYAVAMAVKRGSPNGEMEVAVRQYEKAMEKFRKLERKHLARQGVDG